MYEPSVDGFQLIRFFANEADNFNADVPTLKQADSLLTAGIARCVSALGLGMEFVFTKNISIGLHEGCFSGPAASGCCDPVSISCVLVDPVDPEPLRCVIAVRSDEMEVLRIDSFG
jgi:hypothetical protein